MPRKSIEGALCDCGRPAVMFKYGKSPVCADCDRIERELYYRKAQYEPGPSPVEPYKAHIKYQTY